MKPVSEREPCTTRHRWVVERTIPISQLSGEKRNWQVLACTHCPSRSGQWEQEKKQ